MKRILPYLVFLFLPLYSLNAEEGLIVKESVSFYSKILKQEVRYSVVLPHDYFITKAAYPVVYLLHGLGDDETSWLEYGRIKQASDKLVKEGEIDPMIFIMPQGFRNYYVNDYAGTFLYQDMFVKELVPLIDSLYRTIPDKLRRALMGYSMGGFGALILPLKYPDIFSVAVPLSISIRTDEQYQTENGEEWDQQWGRLFGGVGKTGSERLTKYYKENSPFHIIESEDLHKYKHLRLFIDNGDDEFTLCRSNEELHILMRKLSFPHEFRIRDGGHEFEFWREALPNGLRFISDAFCGIDYRGDIQAVCPTENKKTIRLIHSEKYNIMLPDEYSVSDRYFPVIYFLGDFSTGQQEQTAGLINTWTGNGILPPVLTVFLNHADYIPEVMSEAENLYRIRKGYRFRAIIATGAACNTAMKICMDSVLFTSCALFDGNPDYNYAENALKKKSRKELSRTWYYIDSPDKGLNYKNNGHLHILFRESELYHEYRVREGAGDFGWFLRGLPEAIKFTQNKIHK